MRVRALVAFAGRVDDNTFSVVVGQEFDLPAGVDWLEAGLVVLLAPDAVVIETPEDGLPVIEKRSRAKRG